MCGSSSDVTGLVIEKNDASYYISLDTIHGCILEKIIRHYTMLHHFHSTETQKIKHMGKTENIELLAHQSSSVQENI